MQPSSREYNPTLNLSIHHPELFRQLREINRPLVENNFHILLANILDDRDLPYNAESIFLRLLQGTHDFTINDLRFELPDKRVIKIRGNQDKIVYKRELSSQASASADVEERFVPVPENIQVFADTIIAINEYIDEHEIDNEQVKALKEYFKCLRRLVEDPYRGTIDTPRIGHCNKFVKFSTRRHKRKGGTKRKKRFTRV